ncbi:MAG: hypothetical protein CMO40_01400 [Verrucomicrobiaceae bacterium]|nr:hypothetical protein [Verrucomicrobiaceae bacterium]
MVGLRRPARKRGYGVPLFIEDLDSHLTRGSIDIDLQGIARDLERLGFDKPGPGTGRLQTKKPVETQLG